jgi:hypothetical protein
LKTFGVDGGENIKANFKEMICEVRYCIKLAQGRLQCEYMEEHGIELLCSVKGGKMYDQLNGYKYYNEDIPS